MLINPTNPTPPRYSPRLAGSNPPQPPGVTTNVDPHHLIRPNIVPLTVHLRQLPLLPAGPCAPAQPIGVHLWLIYSSVGGKYPPTPIRKIFAFSGRRAASRGHLEAGKGQDKVITWSDKSPPPSDSPHLQPQKRPFPKSHPHEKPTPIFFTSFFTQNQLQTDT
jgi:hypothetical protein